MKPSKRGILMFDLDGTLIPIERGRDSGAGDSVARGWIALETPTNYAMLLLDLMGLTPRLRPLLDYARRRKGIATRDAIGVIEGAQRAVAELAETRPLAVVTSRSRDDAEDLLERSSLRSYFSTVVARGDTWRLKPHPAPLRRALHELRAEASESAYVGDLPVDMFAARAAGVRPIGVLTGFSNERALARAGAELVFDSVAALPGARALS